MGNCLLPTEASVVDEVSNLPDELVQLQDLPDELLQLQNITDELLQLPSLPEELLEHIFGYCDLLSLKCMARCDRAHAESCRFALWRVVTLPPLDLVKKTLSEDYHSNFFCHTTDLLAIAKLDPKLEYINPFLDSKQRMNVDQNLNFVFTLCSNLNVLKVSYLTRFEKLSNLVELTLTDHAATDKVLVECCKWLLRLKALHIRDGRKEITTYGFNQISGLEKLQVLTLNISTRYHSFHICEGGLPPRLRELVVVGCYSLNFSSGRYEKFASLTKLRMEKGENNISPIARPGDFTCFQFISSAIFLKELTILYEKQLFKNDSACGCLKNLVHLEVLSLDSVRYFTDEALQTIGDNLVKLKQLVFLQCMLLTNDGLLHLTKLQHLEVLKFLDCDQITREGFDKFNSRMQCMNGVLGVVNLGTERYAKIFTWKLMAPNDYDYDHDHGNQENLI